jgi:hypothetical protein
LFELDASSTVRWTPDVVKLARIPFRCGVIPAPFHDLDVYSLDLTNTKGATTVQIDFVRTDVLNQDYLLSLGPLLPDVANQQTGVTPVNVSPDGDVHFYYRQGPPPIAPLPLSQVIVRIDALPRADGDELVAHATITFADGNVLAFTARPTLPSVTWSPCPEP